MHDRAYSTGTTSEEKECLSPTGSGRSPRGRRAASARSGAATAAAGAKRRRLGNTQITEHLQVRGLQTGHRLARREALQATVRELSRLDRVCRCGCHAAPGVGAIAVKYRPGDKSHSSSAGFAGLERCGSVWACPSCAEKIAAQRGSDLAAGVERWLGAGHGAVMLTLTMRHHAGQALAELWDAKSRAWAAVHRTAAWRGSATTIGDQQRYGIAGWVTGTECTHGRAGWHVHVHALIFTETPLSDDAANGLGARCFSRWSAALQRAGLEAPSRAHGVDALVVRDAAGAGRYVVKGVSLETLAGPLKSARGANRAPLQILSDIGDRGSARDVALWHEWEAASRGRRQMAWSRGMRELLAVEDLTDQEIAEQDLGGEIVGAIALEDWWKIARDAEARAQILAVVAMAASEQQAARNLMYICERLRLTYLAPPS